MSARSRPGWRADEPGRHDGAEQHQPVECRPPQAPSVHSSDTGSGEEFAAQLRQADSATEQSMSERSTNARSERRSSTARPVHAKGAAAAELTAGPVTARPRPSTTRPPDRPPTAPDPPLALRPRRPTARCSRSSPGARATRRGAAVSSATETTGAPTTGDPTGTTVPTGPPTRAAARVVATWSASSPGAQPDPRAGTGKAGPGHRRDRRRDQPGPVAGDRGSRVRSGRDRTG